MAAAIDSRSQWRRATVGRDRRGRAADPHQEVGDARRLVAAGRCCCSRSQPRGGNRARAARDSASASASAAFLLLQAWMAWSLLGAAGAARSAAALLGSAPEVTPARSRSTSPRMGWRWSLLAAAARPVRRRRAHRRADSAFARPIAALHSPAANSCNDVEHRPAQVPAPRPRRRTVGIKHMRTSTPATRAETAWLGGERSPPRRAPRATEGGPRRGRRVRNAGQRRRPPRRAGPPRCRAARCRAARKTSEHRQDQAHPVERRAAPRARCRLQPKSTRSASSCGSVALGTASTRRAAAENAACRHLAVLGDELVARRKQRGRRREEADTCRRSCRASQAAQPRRARAAETASAPTAWRATSTGRR